MKLSIALTLAAALLAQSASAWTFTGRNGAATPFIESGTLNKGCTGINHAKGRKFSWDRPNIGLGAKCCIKLYSNRNCGGSPAGYSCKDWSKTSSVALRSYKVESCLNLLPREEGRSLRSLGLEGGEDEEEVEGVETVEEDGDDDE